MGDRMRGTRLFQCHPLIWSPLPLQQAGLYNGATDPASGSMVPAPSIMATSTPGRIYAEVRTLAEGRNLAKIAGLDLTRIAPVPRESFHRIFDMAPRRPKTSGSRSREHRRNGTYLKATLV